MRNAMPVFARRRWRDDVGATTAQGRRAGGGAIGTDPGNYCSEIIVLKLLFQDARVRRGDGGAGYAAGPVTGDIYLGAEQGGSRGPFQHRGGSIRREGGCVLQGAEEVEASRMGILFELGEISTHLYIVRCRNIGSALCGVQVWERHEIVALEVRGFPG